MNLGKLLVAGRSIMRGRDGMAYRVNKNVFLPKFGTAQNPFQAPVEAEPAEPAKPGSAAAVAPLKQAIAPVAAKTQKMPFLKPGPARAASWRSKLIPISIWRGSPASAPSAQPVVQAELSLDTVKVMHNDLSDADVEMVPMKSRTADKTAPAAPPSKPWEFLAERMFHATTD